MKKLVLCLFALLPLHAMADPVEDKVHKLLEVQNVLQGYKAQVEQAKIQAKEHGRKLIDQLSAQLDPNPEFKAKFRGAVDKLVDTLVNRHTPEDMVDVMAHYYAAHFTEQELDGLIAFSQSDLGQKSMTVSQDARAYFDEYYKADTDAVIASAMSDYVKDVQGIAAACNCARRPVGKKAP